MSRLSNSTQLAAIDASTRRMAGARFLAALAVVLLAARCKPMTSSTTRGEGGFGQRSDGMDRDSNGGSY
jgi:hypothetical protein